QFVGSWIVTEFVYSAAGSLLGTIEQQRRLHTQADPETVLVTQSCLPSPELAAHLMGAFTGEFTFLLRKAGVERLYLGPDVQGHGTSFG
ncbi:hypothetical protein ACXYUI_28840, partial [Klebsiella pneumoniae]